MTVRGILNKYRVPKEGVKVLLINRAGGQRELTKAEQLVPAMIGPDGDMTFASFSVGPGILKIYVK